MDDFTAEDAIASAVVEFNLASSWPDEVIQEVKKLPDEVTKQDLTGRKDLRDLPFVTIDGEDARDFDDAVFCTPEGKGWRLYVAIADVAYYVRPGSAINEEAVERSTSVYFPTKVIPMLPEALSNGLCSLKPNVDRLAIVAEMVITAKGQLKKSAFYPAVIHSHARLTYTEVGAWIEEGDEVWQQSHGLLPHLKTLVAIYRELSKQRSLRGALEFETTETKIKLNDAGEVEEIRPYVRNEAHTVIEECMLMANVAAATFVEKAKVNTVYRIHEPPPKAKITELRAFLQLRGIRLRGGDDPSPGEVNEVLKAIRGREDYQTLQMVVLRTMTQAVYSANNVGHFGLAFDAYTHFTSPIRRYPDLMVHRAIRYVLAKNDPAAKRYDDDTLEQLCQITSTAERNADQAGWAVVGSLKAMFLKRFLGQTFTGIISGVTKFGLFVTLNDLYVDGLVHVRSLRGDFYAYDPERHTLKGERSGETFSLGMEVNVRVAQANAETRRVDFVLSKK